MGPKLHAVLETNKHALEQARALDEERKLIGRRSPLHGIPILVKDSIATLASEGMNTTAGSYALLGSVVREEATAVSKLRKAGAIILGKTNLLGLDTTIIKLEHSGLITYQVSTPRGPHLYRLECAHRA
ncbi:unnamed protein product [Rhizoctonia solani]|uniref:Amidase domain-containing protein n=1 Tax=Rhizoctonia solani TaxID=456999 RepID=A0A8H3C209_9AGAM|nr:unnamed protein product [Rhizoctonia solani]